MLIKPYFVLYTWKCSVTLSFGQLSSNYNIIKEPKHIQKFSLKMNAFPYDAGAVNSFLYCWVGFGWSLVIIHFYIIIQMIIHIIIIHIFIQIRDAAIVINYFCIQKILFKNKRKGKKQCFEPLSHILWHF